MTLKLQPPKIGEVKTITCPECDGIGKTDGKECSDCKGLCRVQAKVIKQGE